MTHLQKTALTLVLLFFGNLAMAQHELDPYKYIIVPKKYDFLKEENQYRVNSYVKFLFVKDGYSAFYQGDEYPADLQANPCLGATAIVQDNSNAFTTKLILQLKDCSGEVVFETVQGTSKEKSYDKTYIAALKKCFVSVKALDYNYDPGANAAMATNANIPQKTMKTESTTVQVAVPVSGGAVTVQKHDEVDQQPEPSLASDTTDATETPEVVVTAPVVPATKSTNNTPIASDSNTVVAKSYKNEQITFLLINQGAQLQAYVTKSANELYKQGEMIGTFEKTSLPNVFRVTWKAAANRMDQTTAYFDDQGNLKIDIHRNGKLEVATFTEAGK